MVGEKFRYQGVGALAQPIAHRRKPEEGEIIGRKLSAFGGLTDVAGLAAGSSRSRLT